ncbi:MAG: hypothetical protein QOJ12_3340 [Thermoleophilales bacterium]|nr:hypothetical protein [Thermoleophilales bacterium]
MTIAIVVAACIVLFVLAFLFPRLSRGPQKAGNEAISLPQRGAGKAPGRLGRWLQKPFSSARKMFNKSGSEGRHKRSKMPF